MKRFSSRRPSRGPQRPTRVWVAANTGFTFVGVTGTSASIVMQLQAPTDVTNLTADPPEDLTILRMRGSFSVTLAGDASASVANWVLALTVQDVTWTPSSSFLTDADKRILWSMSYTSNDATFTRWLEPDTMQAGTTTLFGVGTRGASLDIAPKVKLEAGKALYLVAYEMSGAVAFSVTTRDMRILFQRSRRR